MKVLLVHSFLYPEHGGDSVYTLRLGRLLEEQGNEVGYFGMRDPRNVEHPLSHHEVAPIDFDALNVRKSFASGLRVLGRAVYSPAARRHLGRLLDEWHPDIVHLQSIHYHLTTSILPELYARRIPVVWTQHNLALVCCNTMLKGDTICERCKPNRFYSPILIRCKKGSLAASLVGSLQLSADHLRGVYEGVDRFITVSRFYKEKLAEFGFDRSRISVVPNPYEAPPAVEDRTSGGRTGYLLCLGRLTPEKGVETLIDAMPRLPGEIELLVVGDGPQRPRLERRAAERGARVRFLGERRGAELEALIGGCLLSVTPSICYENFPNTVVESFIRGKPVVAAAIGGLPELVVHGETGLLFRPGDASDLAGRLDRALRDRGRLVELGEKARAFALRELDPRLHYRRLMEIYERHTDRPLAAARHRWSKAAM